jgi:septal ring factor EnvC (AmiA/AmiB activator)
LNIEEVLTAAPIVILILSTLGGAAAWLYSRGNSAADTAAQLTESAMQLVERLERRLAAIEAKNEEYRRRLTDLDAANAILRGRVSSLEQDVKTYARQMVDLETVNVKLKERIDQLLEKIERLKSQFERGSRPDWRIDE